MLKGTVTIKHPDANRFLQGKVGRMELETAEWNEEEIDDVDSRLYNFLQIREVRIILAAIGILSAFMPWIYTDTYGTGISYNLVSFIEAPDTAAALLIFIVLYLVGMVICAFKWELSAYVGVPILWIGYLGTMWKLPNDEIFGSAWGAGVYFALAASLVLLFIPLRGLKQVLDEFASPSP